MRPVVAIERCEAYEDCDAAVLRALEHSGLLRRLADRKVLLKPNLMKGAPPEACEATHPLFVAAVVRCLVEQGCEVLVGDSSGLLGFTTEVLQVSGTARAVADAGGTAVSLDRGPFAPIGIAGKTFWVPRLLFEVDAVVQVPKLKTHTLMTLSCAVKNLMGLLPGATKCALHLRRPTPEGLARALLELELQLERAGVVMGGAVVDGIWALGGKGRPGGGVRRRRELVIAGAELSAVDLVSAHLLGLPPMEVPTIRSSRALRRGPVSLADVEIRGEEPNPLADLERPLAGLKDRFALLHLAHYLLRSRIVGLVHIPARCEGHGACREVCPTGAISGTRSSLRISRACVRCYACHEVCPSGAMALHVPPLLRPLFRRRAAGLEPTEVR